MLWRTFDTILRLLSLALALLGICAALKIPDDYIVEVPLKVLLLIVIGALFRMSGR